LSWHPQVILAGLQRTDEVDIRRLKLTPTGWAETI
jgi:hypothetical protein